MGVAPGAFLWSASPWFIALKLQLATWLVNSGVLWPLQTRLPWWLLTDYPGRNDVMTLLDGATLLIFILTAAAVLTLAIAAPLLAAARLLGPARDLRRFHHLALALLPQAACGVILGLSAQTVSLLHADGLRLLWVPTARAVALALACSWSLLLVWQIAGTYAKGVRRALSVLFGAASVGAALSPWLLLFWVW